MKRSGQGFIRNVGLIGHGGSGKTSIAEALLYVSGASDRLGKVGDISSVMDFDPEEIKRGHSINSSLAFLEWQKNKINLLDTPGSSNFIADTSACLRVVDGAVLVIGGEMGIQYFTEKTWQWAMKNGVRVIIMINKIEHERLNIFGILESFKKKFKKTLAFLQMPLIREGKVEGIVDLVDNVFHVYSGDGKSCKESVPVSYKDMVDIARAELIESIAECDENLLEKYLEEGKLTHDEMLSGMKTAIEAGELIPAICGSATENVGIDLMAQAMVDYLPSPGERSGLQAKGIKDGLEITLDIEAEKPFSSLVFKTIADPYAGKLSLFRVFSGSVKSDSIVYNANKGANERIGQLYALQGKKQVQLTEVVTGDFATIAKLKTTGTGDTLTVQDKGFIFDPIEFPQAVLARAVMPKTRADEEKISNALNRLVEEDATLKIERNTQTHELLVSGMGQVHLDVTFEKLKRRFGVEVDVKTPKVPYRETIRGKIKVQGKYKKQTGGRGQFGDTWIEIEPLGKGGGFEFVDNIVGGTIPRQYIPAVEKGVHEAMNEGVLAHCPMVDIRVTLYDGSFHNVDSSEMAFKIAGSMGFKKGVVECKPILLEPIMKMEVVVPSECVGDVMGDLNSKRGKILGIDALENTQNIRVEVPMASVLNYAPDLTSLTGGRGIFMMEDSHYEDVPEHISTKIIDEVNRLREEEHKG
tara:strand:- start:7470 stop:9560 length:2091 start_codon:yes stop_codon:yes gene_type:complete